MRAAPTSSPTLATALRTRPESTCPGWVLPDICAPASTLLERLIQAALPPAGTIAERGQEEVYRRVGLPDGAAPISQAGAAPAPGARVACGVCLSDVAAAEVTAMECGHAFCNACWREHLRYVWQAVLVWGGKRAGLCFHSLEEWWKAKEKDGCCCCCFPEACWPFHPAA